MLTKLGLAFYHWDLILAGHNKLLYPLTTTLILFFCVVGLNAQTPHDFNDHFYNNNDASTGQFPDESLDVSGCSSIQFFLSYSFNQAWEGTGNLETACETCPNPGTCADYLSVSYSVGGSAIFGDFIGDCGTTDAEQSGSINSGIVCTNGASSASISVIGVVRAMNESLSTSGISIICWELSASVSSSSPICSDDDLVLTGTVSPNSDYLSSSTWTNSGTGMIASTSNLSTTASNAEDGETYTLILADINGCDVSEDLVVAVTASVTSTFAQLGPFCKDEIADILPNTSMEGITGTWSPATISTAILGTFTFTFTPDNPGQCGTAATMDIEVSTIFPVPCTSPTCVIMDFGITNVMCNDNNTPSDTLDDFISFELAPQGTDLGSTYSVSVSSGSITPTSANYGGSTLFSLNSGSVGAGNVDITVSDDNTVNCNDVMTIIDPGSCISGTCQITIGSLNNVTCNDNGTPLDESDDTFSSNGTVTGSNVGAGWTADDPSNASGIYGSAVTFGPYPVSGGTVSFNITDMTDASCSAPVNLDPSTCFNGTNCSLLIGGLSNLVCDDNGTGENTSDDFITFTLDPKGSETSSTYTLSVNNGATVAPSSGSYGSPISVALNAGSGSVTVTITDASDPNCSIPVVIPDVCSSSGCVIDDAQGSVTCNDNGTPTNSSDDFLVVTVDPIGSMLGSSYQVLAGYNVMGSGNYNKPLSFDLLPGSANIPNFAFRVCDDSDPACCKDFVVSSTGPCSDMVCNITSAGISGIVCNVNSTFDDLSDDFISFTLDPLGNFLGLSGYSFSVSPGSANVTGGSYGSPVRVTLSPGSANQDITITLTDNELSDCSAPFTIPEQGPCSNTSCDYSQTGYSGSHCDDNGTPLDPTDDRIVFTLDPEGFSLGSYYNVQTLNYNVFPFIAAYGGPTDFTMSSGSAGQGRIFASIVDGTYDGCTELIEIDDPGTCEIHCDIISAGVSNIDCDQNGTVGDESDDFIIFDLNPIGNDISTSYSVFLDNFSNPIDTGVYGTSSPFALPIGSAGAGDVMVIIMDNFDSTCTFESLLVDPGPCSGVGCLIIEPGLSNTMCNNSRTPFEGSDDYIFFDLNPFGANLGTHYTISVSIGTVSPTVGIYGMNTRFIMNDGSASNGDIVVTITDEDNPDCSLPVTVIDPGICSDDCSISTVFSTAESCDPNGTPLDPSDDVFFFGITVNGTKTGPNWISDDPNGTNGAYGEEVFFGPFPISNGGFSFTIQDAIDSTCKAVETVSAPSTCSNECFIGHSLTSTEICDDNGTPMNPNDDSFTFGITVIGTNVGAGWSATDPNTTSGDYNTQTIFGPYPISSGNFNFVISDNSYTTCITNVSIVAPDVCSSGCFISSLVSTSATCNDNGTPFDGADDTYSFGLTVNSSNAGSGWSADDPNGMVGVYGTEVTFGPYLISNGGLSLHIVDNYEASCMTVQSVVAPQSCSNNCQLSFILTSSEQCDDNGTPFDPADDTYSFSVLVNGSGVGATWTADDPNLTLGLYGSVVNFGPYAISGGDLSFNISDDLNPGCPTMISVEAPMTCSDDCSLSVTIISSELCDDNGTPLDANDDTYSLELMVSGLGVGSTWTADDLNITSGSYGSTVIFGPYLISAGDFSFTISDDNDIGCSMIQNVLAPGTCSNKCSISSFISSPALCDDDNTPSDSTDDTFTFGVTVVGTNTSANWIANDPNTTAGIYNTEMILGPYSIIGGDFVLTIADAGDPLCATTETIVAPISCSEECDMSSVKTSMELCDDNGTANDPTDDMFSFGLILSGSNTGPGWSANDPNATTGLYGVETTFGPYPISGGGFNMVILDDLTASCSIAEIISAPNTCSSDCAITSMTISPEICDDNNTPLDASDDTYSFQLVVNGSNTASGWTADDPNATSGSYGTPLTFGPYPIIVGGFNMILMDDIDASCIANVSVIAPTACSDMCSLSSFVSSEPICDANGTPLDPTDDLYSFGVTVFGTNSGASWTANDPNQTIGLYNVEAIFGPYLISGGTIDITIFDDNDTLCTTDEKIDPPPTCSDQSCEIIHIGLNNIQCYDNNTPLDVTDDIIFFSINPSGNNLGIGYTIEVPIDAITPDFGVYSELSTFQLSAGSAGFGNIEGLIRDNNSSNCTFHFTITDPGICSVECNPDTSIINPSICANEEYSIIVNGNLYNENRSTGVELLSSSNGCDSVVIINLIYQPLNENIINEQHCAGRGYEIVVNGTIYNENNPTGLESLLDHSGCDSLIEIDLSFGEIVELDIASLLCFDEFLIVNGNRYDISNPKGSEIITLDNQCDSIIYIDLSFSELKTTISGSPAFCSAADNGFITIETVDPFGSELTYSFDNVAFSPFSDTSFTIHGLINRSYSVFLKDQKGCVNEHQITLQNDDTSSFLDLGRVLVVDPNQSGTLIVNTNLKPVDYDWSHPELLSCTECLITEITPIEKSTLLSLTITGESGCVESAEVLVLLSTANKDIYIPEAISPDGNGINERFTLFALADDVMIIKSMVIYDRRGRVVFNKSGFAINDISLGWDGSDIETTSHGDVYIYFIEVEYSDGGSEIFQGDLTVLR